jgi:hypothetical protein
MLLKKLLSALNLNYSVWLHVHIKEFKYMVQVVTCTAPRKPYYCGLYSCKIIMIVFYSLIVINLVSVMNITLMQ